MTPDGWIGDWADEICANRFALNVEQIDIAAALRAAKQAGVDEERARCIAVLREAASEYFTGNTIWSELLAVVRRINDGMSEK